MRRERVGLRVRRGQAREGRVARPEARGSGEHGVARGLIMRHQISVVQQSRTIYGK